MKIGQVAATDRADVERRRIIKRGFIGAIAGLACFSELSAKPLQRERRLGFYHLHTGEKLEVVYHDARGYVDGALAEVNHLLRDHRDGEVHVIEPSLLDLLFGLERTLAAATPFHVICGYRAPATNAALAAHSADVGKHSLHMQGKAIDIRLPGRELGELRRAALALRSGGVGYYPRSDFVHVDVGRVRYW
jgi:uncharacterized protein YcbK (DUF882 family)